MLPSPFVLTKVMVLIPPTVSGIFYLPGLSLFRPLAGNSLRPCVIPQ